MDYQLLILASKNELMAVDIVDDGECDIISIDGDFTLPYDSVEDFHRFAGYICDTYNVDRLDEMDAMGTILSCGASNVSLLGLMKELQGLKGIDAMDVKKLLPIVAENKGLLQKNAKLVLKLMGNYYNVSTDAEGVTKVKNNKVSSEAIELEGSDFGFLYFFKAKGVGVSEEELTKYQREMDILRKETEDRVNAAEQAASAEIAAMQAKYDNIIREHAQYKKIVDDLQKQKQETSTSLANACMGDIVKLGKYPTNSEPDLQPIEWEVLEVERNRALLLSRKCLDFVPYGNNITHKWLDSYLKRWLNGSFYNKAFSKEEKGLIEETMVENPLGTVARGMFSSISSIIDSKPQYEEQNAVADKIKVFILSKKDIDKYLPSAASRRAKATKFAGAKFDEFGEYGKFDDQCVTWWMRSVYAGCVNSYGDFTDMETASTLHFVRPAIWVKIN